MEGLEDAFALGHRHADAAVLTSMNTAAVGIAADAQLDAALVGELDRVAGQVEQHLAQAHRVAADPARPRQRQVEREGQALLRGRRA